MNTPVTTNPSMSGVLMFFAVLETAIIYNFASNLYETKDALSQCEAQVEKLKLKCEAERVGRINLQKDQRNEKILLQDKQGYMYRAIAYVESPFPDRRGTPRQPILVRAAKGRIRFCKNIQHEHFSELQQFSHIWALFVFHENTTSSHNNLPAKIKPPRLHGKRVGCLSTRSPHRPNNIGLSVCEVVGIGKDYIEIAGIDMVDGTPIIDVKPYIPYDAIPSDISLPMATDADGNSLLQRKLSVPEWIYEADVEMRSVSFTAAALAALDDIALCGRLKHCGNTDEAKELITQVGRNRIGYKSNIIRIGYKSNIINKSNGVDGGSRGVLISCRI